MWIIPWLLMWDEARKLCIRTYGKAGLVGRLTYF